MPDDTKTEEVPQTEAQRIAASWLRTLDCFIEDLNDRIATGVGANCKHVSRDFDRFVAEIRTVCPEVAGFMYKEFYHAPIPDGELPNMVIRLPGEYIWSEERRVAQHA